MQRKKEEIVMRNRFHKEPVDPNNIIRPDQAGTKENPDYVVNIQGNSKTDFDPCNFEPLVDTILKDTPESDLGSRR